MQEEVTQKTIALVFKSSRLTADVLKKAMKMYLERRKAGQQATHGKMSVKKLVGQGMGASSIEVKVKLSDAKAWLIKLQADGRGYSTIHSVRGVVRPAFQMAVDDDLIRKNPFEFQLCTVVVNDSVTREAITRKQESSWNLLRMMSIINDTMMVCLSFLKPDFVFQSSAD